LLKASYHNGTARKRTSSRLRRTNDRSVLKVHEDHEDDENAEIEDCGQSHNGLYINLLNSQIYSKYLNEPWLLREEILQKLKSSSLDKSIPIIIDEVQRVPLLLDEVHLMIEEYDLKFALCGSSARKIKQGQANLLGGRALKYELYGLSAIELGEEFNLRRMINQGYLPKHYLSSANKAKDLWNSYISDYLKEEIAAEALVRNLPVFSEFLRSAAFSDTEVINFSNIARDCGISSKTVKEYFQILEDTLIGSLLVAYRENPKRKVILAPKFYYCDVGIVNNLLRRSNIEIKSELFGKAFENWVYHELRCYNSYQRKFWELSYWRLASGAAEVDFIINDMECAIEAKATDKIKKDELKGLRELIKDQPSIKKRIVVSLVDSSRLTEDGIEILNYMDFIKMLRQGKI
jgi:predicted AAA+ superfamily ATPase